MRENLKAATVVLAVTAVVLAVFLPSNVFAQSDDTEAEDSANFCGSPVAQNLVDELGFDCEQLAAQGIGLGEMKLGHASCPLPG